MDYKGNNVETITHSKKVMLDRAARLMTDYLKDLSKIL